MQRQTTNIPLSDDAAMAAALASTAMPFAHSGEDEGERWLRTLRLHGQVGRALQGLGVGEAPLESTAEKALLTSSTPPLGPSAVDRALRAAEGHAAGRGGTVIETADLLKGLFDVYGGLIDHALARRGARREEVLERLAEAGGQREPA